MPTDIHKNPWFLTLVALSLWCWGYITADDQRIERQASSQYPAATNTRSARPTPRQQCGWQDIAQNSHTP